MTGDWPAFNCAIFAGLISTTDDVVAAVRQADGRYGPHVAHADNRDLHASTPRVTPIGRAAVR